MNWSKRGNLKLGSNVVEILLPHRRPFLMVDFIHAFHPGSAPVLEAGRQITANEGFFAGHFPGLHIWPGAFTIEGLGQTGVLLITLLYLRREAEAQGKDPESVLEALRNLDLGFRLQQGYRPEVSREMLQSLLGARSQIAVGTSVQMKFLRPVFAGQELDYRVTLTGLHGGGMRFEAEASVEGSVVASGIMMGAAVSRPNLPVDEDVR
jgi:3-hydroxyacyl-[acyl-carrier-protein] dehydratase